MHLGGKGDKIRFQKDSRRCYNIGEKKPKLSFNLHAKHGNTRSRTPKPPESQTCTLDSCSRVVNRFNILGAKQKPCETSSAHHIVRLANPGQNHRSDLAPDLDCREQQKETLIQNGHLWVDNRWRFWRIIWRCRKVWYWCFQKLEDIWIETHTAGGPGGRSACQTQADLNEIRL